ncbi:MAG: P-II family nitrogen regulator [Clostridiales bacterium]|nr:P-II family nitrogen regulator [Clostridiales bacterium]MCD8051231.1 P-II family nitrogen regulator [Clostridiales bacterium]MCD8189021.1 P-II family nitrogen regulator [Clostridiales bacterium]MCD8352754.1 P-II family nitrogen regulator [Clostridiales bacterium]
MSKKIYKVEIVTRREKFPALKDALNEIGIDGMTVYKVEGCGAQGGHLTYYRGVKREVHLLPKIKVDLFICETPLEKVFEAVEKTLRTGEYGDGKVFVTECYDALRVRTGERGEAAFIGPCEC